MTNRKHLRPTAREAQLSFGDLVSFAVANGLGMNTPNQRGKWQWNFVDLEVRSGLSERTIRNAIDGRKPHKTTFQTLLDTFCHNEEHQDEWDKVFQSAYSKIKRGKKKQEVLKGRRTSGILEKLYQKLSRLKQAFPIFIGPSYLDVLIYPVHTSRLIGDAEYSNLYEPEVLIGGSCVFSARHLYSKYGISSDLVTSTGTGDSIWSQFYARLLKEEDWILQLFEVSQGPSPYLTFALRNAKDGSKTMFTSTPQKIDFTWETVMSAVELENRGDIVHLSGLMKTNLHFGLSENLAQLSPRKIVVLDQGRFTPGQKETDCQREIVKALGLGLVDVHLTNLSDFQSLFDYPLVEENGPLDSTKIANKIEIGLHQRRFFTQAITAIRDYDYAEKRPILIAIVEDEVIDLSARLPGSAILMHGFAYAGNNMNAAIVHALINLAPDDDNRLENIVNVIEMAANEQFEIRN